MTDADRLDHVRHDLLTNGFAIVRAVIGEDDVAAIKGRLAYVAVHAAF